MAAKHKRRTEHSPQRHLDILLVSGKSRHAGVASFGADADMAQGQHIAVGPCPGGPVRVPAVEYGKMIFQLLPTITEIPYGTPHVGMLLYMFGFIDGGFSG